MKRVISVLLTIFLAITLFGACTKPTETAPASENAAPAESAPAAVEGGKKIALSTQIGHPYANALEKIIRSEAELYGYTVDTFDTKGDLDTQIKSIENMIAKQYDAIIMQPYDAKALVEVTKKAVAAGIPVITAGMELIEEGQALCTTYIGSSGVAEGISGGEMTVEALGGKGNIVAIEGAPGHPLVPERGGEAYKIMEAAGIKILDKQTGNWDRNESMTVMEQFITAYPGQIDAVYCHDSGMAMGAIAAIEASGLTDKIKVISINGTKEEYDAIKEGKMYGTVLNDVSFIGKNTVRACRDHFESTPVLSRMISPADKITKENVNNYTPWF